MCCELDNTDNEWRWQGIQALQFINEIIYIECRSDNNNYFNNIKFQIIKYIFLLRNGKLFRM